MKDTCKTCGASFLATPRWRMRECPMCFISSIEEHTGWTCGECSYTLSHIPDIDVFYVYRVGEKYRMRNRAQVKKNLSREQPCFSGKIEACLNYIRRHEQKKE